MNYDVEEIKSILGVNFWELLVDDIFLAPNNFWQGLKTDFFGFYFFRFTPFKVTYFLYLCKSIVRAIRSMANRAWLSLSCAVR